MANTIESSSCFNLTPNSLFLSSANYHLYALLWFIAASRTKGVDIEKWQSIYWKFKILFWDLANESTNTSEWLVLVDKSMQIVQWTAMVVSSLLSNAWVRIGIATDWGVQLDHNEWMRARLTKEEISFIDQYKDSVQSSFVTQFSRSNVLFVWWCAFDYWNQTIDRFWRSTISMTVMRDFWGTVEKVIKKAYENDWLPQDYINEKSKELTKRDSRVWIILTQQDQESISVIKKRIREEIKDKIPDYFFDCIIHAVDDQKNWQNIFRDIMGIPRT